MKQNWDHNYFDRGFTLIEILVAMVIFSITMLILFSSFQAFLSSSALLRDEVRQAEGSRLGLKIIHQDLEQLFILQPPRYQKPDFDSQTDEFRFLGTQINTDQRTFSQLAFSSLNHITQGNEIPGHLASIVYYVNSHGDRFNLHRADRTFQPLPHELDPCLDPILFKDISEFKLVYVDVNGDNHDNWDSESREFEFSVPRVVRMEIGFSQPLLSRPVKTAFVLPVSREVVK